MKITKVKVKIKFTEDVLGTVPKSQKVYDEYIKTRAKGKETADEFASPLDKEQEELKAAKGWTGFHEEKGKPFLFDYQVKGFLKEAANTLKNQLGTKNLKSKIESYVFVKPRKIFFDGKRRKDPIERPLRAMTAQGPRVTLAKSDAMLAGSKIEFELNVLDGPVSRNALNEILDYGQFKGLCQARGMGFGRFTYKIVK